MRNSEKYITSYNEEVEVFGVSEAVINGLIPGPKPERPKVEMKIRGGKGTQKRWAKEGDAEYSAWLDETNAWETEREALRDQARIVLSLRNYKYPEPIPLPEYLNTLIVEGLFLEPSNVIVKKYLYLLDGILNEMDEMEINMIVMKLSGMPEEVVDEIKQKFWRSLQEPTVDRDRGEDEEDRVN